MKLPKSVTYGKYKFNFVYLSSYNLSKLGYGKICGLFDERKHKIFIATDSPNVGEIIFHELFHLATFIAKAYPSLAKRHKEPDEYLISSIEPIKNLTYGLDICSSLPILPSPVYEANEPPADVVALLPLI